MFQKRWNPYAGGIFAGLLMAASAWVSGRFFGSATSIVRTSAMVGTTIMPKRVQKLDYFQEHTPGIDWQWMFVLGISIGSMLSALTSGSFKLRGVPKMWEERFGPSKIKRAVAAFFGGIVSIIGVRVAQGCPSGHMSGMVQLSLGSMVALTSFFTGGIISSHLVYGGGYKNGS